MSASIRRSASIAKRLAGELVHDVEQLQDPAVVGHVELEVKRPHVIWALGPQPVARHRRFPAALAFAALGRHPQPFLAPQPLGALAVDRPALLEQMLMRLAIPPARPLARERPQLRSQRRVVLGHQRLTPLGRAGLTDIPARPPLREAETVLEHQDRSAPTRRAQNFPLAISFNACDLEHLIGDDPLELRVLGLQLLQPLDIVGLHPAELGAPTVIRRL